MKNQSIALILVLALLVAGAVAENPPSKSLKLETPKSLRGTLQDQTEAAIPDTEIQLLDAHKKLVKSVTSDKQGQYDFGTLAPGEYHIRIKSKAWGSKPTVACTGDVCTIAPLFASPKEEKDPVAY
jgi:SdrD B-like protein